MVFWESEDYVCTGHAVHDWSIRQCPDLKLNCYAPRSAPRTGSGAKRNPADMNQSYLIGSY